MNASHPLDTHKQSYTTNFPHYEENRMTHAAYGERVARLIRGHGLSSALSLGIGHTEVAQRILSLLQAGPLNRYTIVEGAPEILADFQASLDPPPGGLELIEGMFETFTYPDRFQLIEAGFVLEHVDDPALVLTRLHDFLTPGGRIAIAVPNARSLHRLIGHMADLLADVYALSPADLALGHRRYFDLASLAELVRDCGYEITRTEGMLLKPFTTAQLDSLNLTPAVWDALLRAAAPYPDISNAIYLEARA